MTSPTERTAAWAKTEVGEYNHWINTGPLGGDRSKLKPEAQGGLGAPPGVDRGSSGLAGPQDSQLPAQWHHQR